MGVTFITTIYKGNTKNVAGIVVPEEVIASLGGGKKPAVTIKLPNYVYRSTVGKMGDTYMISLSSEHRQASGLNGGETVEVELELDTAPRITPIPDDVRQRLENEGLLDKFESVAPSRRKEVVRQVEEAKSPETRSRRLDKVLEALR